MISAEVSGQLCQGPLDGGPGVVHVVGHLLHVDELLAQAEGAGQVAAQGVQHGGGYGGLRDHRGHVSLNQVERPAASTSMVKQSLP